MKQIGCVIPQVVANVLLLEDYNIENMSASLLIGNRGRKDGYVGELMTDNSRDCIYLFASRQKKKKRSLGCGSISIT